MKKVKVAVIGSRGLKVINDLGKNLPEETKEIVSGGLTVLMPVQKNMPSLTI